MKRSYDSSFVDDKEDIPNEPHSLLEPTATPATHSPIGLFTPSLPLFLGSLSPEPNRPSVSLRVPLLIGSSSLDSDFQSNAALLHTEIDAGDIPDRYFAQDEGNSHRLSGLGILYGSAMQENGMTTATNSETNLYLENLDTTEFGYGSSAQSSSSSCGLTTYDTLSSGSVPSLLYPSSSDETCAGSYRATPEKNSVQQLLELYSPQLLTADAPFSQSEPVVGLIPDINLRTLASKYDDPEPGVDPAAIMGDVKMEEMDAHEVLDMGTEECEFSDNVSLTRDLPNTETPKECAEGIEFSNEAITAIVTVLSACKEEEDAKGPIVTLPPPPLPHLSAVPFLFLPSPRPIVGSFVFPPDLLLHLQGPAGTTGASLPSACHPICSPALPLPVRSPLVEIYRPQNKAEATPTPHRTLHPQSPVLNAHLGIELEELRRRADEFRRRNPGFDIDKNWLQSYAGRLSQRGELLEDYRCYINGCSQTNRRRDHILVHVGSHVEYRPYQCMHCDMRFLRKNECKRHEASHTGHKPFQCMVCAPLLDKSFVRQDLLKRHLRVTHGVQPEMDRRKRRRVGEDGDYYRP